MSTYGGPGGPAPVEDLLRELAPRVLTAVVRRYGHFDSAEDAVQEALLAASSQWPEEGVPENPRGWLITVAARRLTDLLRTDGARRRREDAVASFAPAGESRARLSDSRPAADSDDTLTLLFFCCHPSLTPATQVALTLRAVGGLGTGEIARAFLVPETTMAQRISRAKQTIRKAGADFGPPPPGELDERIDATLHVLYLIFNEGYTATAGSDLQRADLTSEAIRLTRELHRLLPGRGEVSGLLALMLLTDARRAARSRPDGALVPLADQDRSLWDAGAIEEGVTLITGALRTTVLGPYQLQAAIAAVHSEAEHADETDWRQILALYTVLSRVSDNPMVTLNQAVVVAMVHGPEAGLASLEPLDHDARTARSHRLSAVRGHLLDMVGDRAGATAAYRLAARSTTSEPERHYLESRIRRLDDTGQDRCAWHEPPGSAAGGAGPDR
ncbi:RNA polymerase sigma factor [Amycolatopsis antarctica]|uniref:RNA polymerase sigma factor n=1 Tax=Amycolatopsis antarctica TaxID=1854586 RepID=UPI001F0B63A8|nr:DUF6596 domain-containing protein [Amycolatopsis antarctica]